MSKYILVEGITPAFRDSYGNLIVVGDWVTFAARQGSSLEVLVARVEKIEPREVSEYVPEGDNGDWISRPVTRARVQVRSAVWRGERYDGRLVKTWRFKKAAWPNVDNMVAYNGKVPDVAE